MNVILFILLAIFSGGSFVAIAEAIHQAPPLFSGMLRIGTSLLLFAMLAPWIGTSLRIPPELRLRVYVGGLLAQGFPFALLFWAEKHIPPGLAGILNGTVPIWTFFLGWAFMRHAEPPSRRKLIGVLMGLSGVALIFAPKLFAAARSNGSMDSMYSLLGSAAVVGMAICYAGGFLLNRSILSGRGPAAISLFTNMFHQCLVSVAFLAALSALTETWPDLRELSRPRSFAGAILYLGILPGGLGFLVYGHLIRAWGAVRASSLTYLIPLVALVLDFAFYGHLPTALEVGATGIILAGVVLIQKSRS